MSQVIVAGTVRVPTENLPGLRPAMAQQIAATRAEDGCIVYCFAEDVLEPGLIRIFEIWRDQAALTVHFGSPHMATWRAAGDAAGLHDRNIMAYDSGDARSPRL